MITMFNHLLRLINLFAPLTLFDMNIKYDSCNFPRFANTVHFTQLFLAIQSIHRANSGF